MASVLSEPQCYPAAATVCAFTAKVIVRLGLSCSVSRFKPFSERFIYSSVSRSHCTVKESVHLDRVSVCPCGDELKPGSSQGHENPPYRGPYKNHSNGA